MVNTLLLTVKETWGGKRRMYRRMKCSALAAASDFGSRASGSFPLQEGFVPDTIAPASAVTVLPRGVASRLFGAVASPRQTYAGVAAQPRWAGAFLVVAVVSGLAATVFSATDVGQRAIFDQQVSRMEASGRHLSDAQAQALARMVPYFTYFALPFQLVFFGAGGVLVAAVACGVLTGTLGGDATFQQVFAIVAHSGAILAPGFLFALPLDYAHETMTSPTSLMVFLPMIEDGSFAARLLGAFDLFRIWWAINLAIGLGVLYRRPTAPIAATIVFVYTAIALAYAAIMSAL